MAARTRSRFDIDEAQPQSDVYTGLLGLSLVAMIVSCLLLYLDFSQYGTSKPPTVTVPAPKSKEGVQTGQLPPPLLQLPPPEPIGERPFTRGQDVAAQPVKPVAGEESQQPTATQATVPMPPEAPKPVPIADVPVPPPTGEPGPLVSPPAPQPKAETQSPTPEPLAVPPSSTPPPAPPLPKSIKQLPN